MRTAAPLLLPCNTAACHPFDVALACPPASLQAQPIQDWLLAGCRRAATAPPEQLPDGLSAADWACVRREAWPATGDNEYRHLRLHDYSDTVARLPPEEIHGWGGAGEGPMRRLLSHEPTCVAELGGWVGGAGWLPVSPPRKPAPVLLQAAAMPWTWLRWKLTCRHSWHKQGWVGKEGGGGAQQSTAMPARDQTLALVARLVALRCMEDVPPHIVHCASGAA